MKLTIEQIKKVIREEMGTMELGSQPNQDPVIAVKQIGKQIKALATASGISAENIIGMLIDWGDEGESWGPPVMENKNRMK